MNEHCNYCVRDKHETKTFKIYLPQKLINALASPIQQKCYNPMNWKSNTVNQFSKNRYRKEEEK